MTTALLSPVLHDIHASVVSVEEGDLTLRIGPDSDGLVLGAHALAEALAEANRLLADY
jgi:hypothetical protein